MPPIDEMNLHYDAVEYPAVIVREFISSYPNHEMDSQWHDEVEFLTVLSGSVRCNVNGENIMLHDEEGIFINSHQVHFLIADEKQECEFITVRFHPMLLCATSDIENRFVLPVLENEDYPFQVLRPVIEWQRSVLDALLRVYYMRHEITLELGAQGQFFSIWEQIFLHSGRVPATERRSSPQLSQLKDMISYIAENYRSKVTLNDIRQVGNMGKTNCCQLFQKYLNQTPMLYLTMFRLRKGAELLAKTEMPIVDISYEVGFSGASYFAEAFKKHMGEMPSEYRKKHQTPKGMDEQV